MSGWTMARKFLLLGAVTAPLALGQAAGPLQVDGTVNLHGPLAPSLDTGSISAQAGPAAGTPIDRPLPAFEYGVPPVDTVVGGPIPSGATTITGPGAGAGTVTEYTATSLGVGDTLTITGGGTVMIHVTGNLSLDHTTFTISDGTRVVLYVDGTTTFNYVTLTQTGGGSLQIQGQGDVTINAPTITGVAFANDTLRLDTDGGAMDGLITMNEGLLANSQEGVRRLRLLPIIEGQ